MHHIFRFNHNKANDSNNTDAHSARSGLHMGYINFKGDTLPLPNLDNALQVEPNSPVPNVQYELTVDMNNQLLLQRAETYEDWKMSQQHKDLSQDMKNVKPNLGPEYQILGERPIQVPVVYDRIRHMDI